MIAERLAENYAFIQAVADALEKAQLGYKLELTRLVDGESTYTLTYSDGMVLTFDDQDEGYEHIRRRRRETQARAAIEAIAAFLRGDQ